MRLFTLKESHSNRLLKLMEVAILLSAIFTNGAAKTIISLNRKTCENSRTSILSR
ncbi:hypothetical protein LM83088_260003 [Listeria monocytogenes]|nr:hypothetical protein LM83088_260003 [Listeria monocytogenes]